jgi:hypothetical protein
MKKRSKLGEKIAQLYAGKSQAWLANYLKVSRPSITAWVGGVNPPPPGMAFKLAALMDDPTEILEFLELAGIEPEVLKNFVEALNRKSLIRPGKDEMVIVPPLRQSSRLPERLLLPAEIVGGPFSFRYFLVPEASAKNGLKVGDLLFVDVSSSTAPTLASFWGERVLVDFNYPADDKANVPSRTQEAGRLVLERSKLSLPSGDLYMALFYPWSDEPPRSVEGPGDQRALDEAAMRSWEEKRGRSYPLRSEPFSHPVGPSNFGYVEPQSLGTWQRRPREKGNGLELAKNKLRLNPGLRILGRVIGWFTRRDGEP